MASVICGDFSFILGDFLQSEYYVCGGCVVITVSSVVINGDDGGN